VGPNALWLMKPKFFAHRRGPTLQCPQWGHDLNRQCHCTQQNK